MKATMILAVALGAAAVLAGTACGPKQGPEQAAGGGVTLVCGGKEALGPGAIDPLWSDETVLETLPVECRWEGQEFRMFRRVADGKLFYRPLFKVVEPPAIDKLGDPSKRTVLIEVMVRVPDVEAACEWKQWMIQKVPLGSAETMPLQVVKMRLDGPVESSACEIGGEDPARLSDVETVRIVFPEAGQAKEVVKAAAADPESIALEIYYEQIGAVREVHCGFAMAHGMTASDVASAIGAAGLTVAEDGSVDATLAAHDTIVTAVAGALGEVLVDGGKFACTDGERRSIAEAAVAGWAAGAGEGTVLPAALDEATLGGIVASEMPVAKVADQFITHAGSCAHTCGACCDARADCLDAHAQDEARCYAGQPGAACVACNADQICDAACVTPPYMTGTYSLTLVEVSAWSCGSMEIGGCDLEVGYRVNGAADWDTVTGKKDAGSAEINDLLYKDASPDAVMEGFEVRILELDPFANDSLGSCTVAVGKEQLVAAWRKKGPPVSEQECQGKGSKVEFVVELGPVAGAGTGVGQ